MRRVVLAVGVVWAATACGGAEEGAQMEETAPEVAGPGVTIVAPAEGAEVVGPDILVQLEASGVTIVPADNHEPGTGHHHIFVDRDLTPLSDTIPAGVSGIIHMGRGQTEFLVEGLAPGEHRIIAVIAEWTHVPLDPAAVDTVHFTVVAPEGGGAN